MKRAGLALLGLALVTASCVAPLDENATGEEVYTALCARCHGSNLEGGVGPALGPGSELVDKPDAYLVSTVTGGRGRMPGFKSSLSSEQIDRVAAYIRDRQAG
jgi:mono/diheme cytochrome c family protein